MMSIIVIPVSLNRGENMVLIFSLKILSYIDCVGVKRTRINVPYMVPNDVSSLHYEVLLTRNEVEKYLILNVLWELFQILLNMP
ncbi:unnamed protein product, partial [Brenthis ino]